MRFELEQHRELVRASITPFGRNAPRAAEPRPTSRCRRWRTGLSCGYDDHALPPIRGGGNQAYHMGAHYAVMALLVALLERERSGRGQLVDVNVHAACNVTTEFATYEWLVGRNTVQRQTGRHATTMRTSPSQVRCADGRHANTGVPPRTPAEFGRLRQWLLDLGLDAEYPEIFLLEMGMAREQIDLSRIGQDEEITAIFAAGRDAIMLIASRLPAADFFSQAQERGIPVGVIYAPEEVLDDPHFRARGFPVEVDHPELGRTDLSRHALASCTRRGASPAARRGSASTTRKSTPSSASPPTGSTPCARRAFSERGRPAPAPAQRYRGSASRSAVVDHPPKLTSRGREIDPA
jgi:crotonobetainyl-CoA:carnitine CoA-transferase CaiB-like acyl-CoA transferase